VKKLLFVATYFPPVASGGNARQLRFLRYLPDFGWEPTVLTVRARGPVPDPEGVRILRPLTPGPDGAYALARRASAAWRDLRAGGRADGGGAGRDGEGAGSGGEGVGSGGGGAPHYSPESLVTDDKRFSRRQDINRWLFVPDVYVGWIGPAISAGLRLVREEGFEAVVSSYPRASAHLVGAGISAHSGIPWLADYRDPWPTHQFLRYKTPLHERANFALESWALGHAAWATAVNEPIADDLRRRYPRLAGRVAVIPNGYDRAEQPEPIALGDGFWFVHTGRLYSRGRQATDFLDALATLPAHVKVLFLGVEGPRIRAYAESIGIADRVRTEPFVPHTTALGYQRAADALLLITGTARESLSSKIFEYLQCGRPIFAVTPPGTAAAALLDETGGGERAAPDRPRAGPLAAFVERVTAGAVAPADQALVDRFDGRTLTGRLAGYLEGISGDTRA